jgi:hypothetical protein
MNAYDLDAIEGIIEDIVERRVNKKMREFFANVRKEYPNLQYDLSKASVGITKSAFDSALSVVPEPHYFHSSNGLENKPYESSFADPTFIVPTGSAFREPPKAEFTLGDYKAQKEHMDIPVSAFDPVAGQECYWDRFNFKREEYVPSTEELEQTFADKPYLIGVDIAAVCTKRLEEKAEQLEKINKDHHNKVLEDVLHLTSEG